MKTLIFAFVLAGASHLILLAAPAAAAAAATLA